MAHACGRTALLELESSYAGCEKCQLLVKSREQVVFGSGSSRANILIVGEAPGAAEDYEGVPHVGDAGKLLMDVLARAWPAADDPNLSEISNIREDSTYFELLRQYLDAHVFWTNAVLCKTADGRPPSAVEVKNCSDRLHRTIYAVDPALIVATGKTAASALVGKAVAISEKRGTIFDIAVPSPVTGALVRYPMLAILCPGYLLKEGDQRLVKKKQGKTYDTIQDMKYALGLLHRLFNDYYDRSFLEP
jgi:uracil-DNA glycosylase family 4